jgi:hypothetical protein
MMLRVGFIVMTVALVNSMMNSYVGLMLEKIVLIDQGVTYSMGTIPRKLTPLNSLTELIFTHISL